MRSLIIALLLFALLLGAISTNFYIVRHVTDQLRTYGLRFAHEGASRAQLEALREQWRRWRFYLSFSVNYRELDHMEELMVSLALSLQTGGARGSVLGWF